MERIPYSTPGYSAPENVPPEKMDSNNLPTPGVPLRCSLDIWALGVNVSFKAFCIKKSRNSIHSCSQAKYFQLIELLTSKNFVETAKREKELSELVEIFGDLPNYADSQDMKKKYVQILNQTKEGILKKIPVPFNKDRNFIDFLSRMLFLDPSKRWTAAKLLNHRWLK